MAHTIDIADCEAGVYTKVRKQLNKSLGSPEFWDYEKPVFSLDASQSDFEKLQDTLGGFEGIKFSPEEPEEPETAPALVPPEETEEAPAPVETATPAPYVKKPKYSAPAPTVPEPAETTEPPEEVDYSKYRC